MLSKNTIKDCLLLISEYFSLVNQKNQILYELDEKIGSFKVSIYSTHDSDTRVNIRNEKFIQDIVSEDFPYFLEDKLRDLLEEKFGG